MHWSEWFLPLTSPAKPTGSPRFYLLSKPAEPSASGYSTFPLPTCLWAALSFPAADTAHAIQKLKSRNSYKETERMSLLALIAKTTLKKMFCLFSLLKPSEFIFEASFSKPCICLTRKIHNNLLSDEYLLSVITFHTSKSTRPLFTFFCNRITDVHFFSRSPAYFLSNSSF